MSLIIARTLGCTLGELGERMTTYEYGLWAAAYQLSPWAGVTFDTPKSQEATLMQFVANTNIRRG
jgi:hypothetical protein